MGGRVGVRAGAALEQKSQLIRLIVMIFTLSRMI